MTKKKSSYEETMKRRREEILKLSETDIRLQTKYIIHFKDCGQDFLTQYIDKKGNVLDSKPLQKSIWAGKHTIPNFVQVGDKLPIWLDGESYVKYPIKKIEIMEEQKVITKSS